MTFFIKGSWVRLWRWVLKGGSFLVTTFVSEECFALLECMELPLICNQQNKRTVGLHTYISQHSPGRVLSSALVSLFLIFCAIVYSEVCLFLM